MPTSWPRATRWRSCRRVGGRSPWPKPVPTGARIGDRVEVAAGGLRLSEDGLVVGTGDGVVVVAVPLAAAPMVAHAIATGDAVLLLAP